METYKGGIFRDTTGDTDIDHQVEVVGWGVENGTKYWSVKNSWGSQFGEQGFFRVVRGENNIMIESNCVWATPKDTWTNDVRHHLTEEEKNDPRNPVKQNVDDKAKGDSFLETDQTRCRVDKVSFKNGEKKPDVHAWESLLPEAVPANWDWRNVNNTNFLSWNKNQHIPVYCGSCWAQGSTSALADRFNILTGNKNPTPIALNAQVIVNCQAGGSCNGGNPGGVYEYAHETGIPDSSCEQYVAHNLGHQCKAIDICKECKPPVCPVGKDCQENCWAVDYKHYYVSKYYSLSGKDKMKAEIYANGPISCGIMVTDKFENYTGGIYSEFRLLPMINHEISVVGYGVENGTEYWIGRNSWGTYWGEGGFFRMATGHYGLGIENDCTAGLPTFTKPTTEASAEAHVFIQ